MEDSSVPPERHVRLRPQGELGAIVGRWRELKNSKSAAAYEHYIDCAESLLNAGASLLAHDVAKARLRHFPNDKQLRLIMGLALARSKATLEAYELPRNLYEETISKSQKSPADNLLDVKIIGLLARVLKDMWQQSRDLELREECLTQSANFYEEAYRLSVAEGGARRYWPGISSATLAVAARQNEKAYKL